MATWIVTYQTGAPGTPATGGGSQVVSGAATAAAAIEAFTAARSGETVAVQSVGQLTDTDAIGVAAPPATRGKG
jgi:hypothetical protein